MQDTASGPARIPPLPAPLAWRPARPEDEGFQEVLYRSTRDDLLSMMPDPALVEPLMAMQYRAQVAGYRSTYPHALYLIVEERGGPMGRVVLDIGADDVRLVDIAFLPAARGRGHGTRVLLVLQEAATRLERPLALSVRRANSDARRLYERLGFQPQGGDAMFEHRLWRPAS